MTKKEAIKVLDAAFDRIFMVLGFPYPVPDVCSPLEETMKYMTAEELEAVNVLNK